MALLANLTGFLLGRGNQKLGPHIYTFSLPAIETCPGRSQACEKACYAMKGRMRGGPVVRSFQRKLKASRKASFANRMIDEIIGRNAKVVRVHCSGDFESAAYVRKWRKIVKACPNVRFYAYTRSWRQGDIRTELVQLSRLKNMRLWFSCDRETGVPTEIPKRVRLAYMLDVGEEKPLEGSDLVFRVIRKTVEKRSEGVLVCPMENGTKAEMTCGTCKICWVGLDSQPHDVRRFSLTLV